MVEVAGREHRSGHGRQSRPPSSRSADDRASGTRCVPDQPGRSVVSLGGTARAPGGPSKGRARRGDRRVRRRAAAPLDLSTAQFSKGCRDHLIRRNPHASPGPARMWVYLRRLAQHLASFVAVARPRKAKIRPTNSLPPLSPTSSTASLSGKSAKRSCFRVLDTTCGYRSTHVHWCPWLSAAIVTQLVTHLWVRSERTGPDLLTRKMEISWAWGSGPGHRGRSGPAGRRYGLAGLGGVWSVWVRFRDAAERDFEAEGAELADVVGDLAADAALALVVIRAEVGIAHAGVG